MSVSPFAPSIKSQKMRHAYYIKSGAVEVHGVQFANLFFQLSIQLLVNFGSILKIINSVQRYNLIYQKDEIILTYLVIIDNRVGTLT